jgi:hypothetical protein
MWHFFPLKSSLETETLFFSSFFFLFLPWLQVCIAAVQLTLWPCVYCSPLAAFSSLLWWVIIFCVVLDRI